MKLAGIGVATLLAISCVLGCGGGNPMGPQPEATAEILCPNGEHAGVTFRWSNRTTTVLYLNSRAWRLQVRWQGEWARFAAIDSCGGSVDCYTCRIPNGGGCQLNLCQPERLPPFLARLEPGETQESVWEGYMYLTGAPDTCDCGGAQVACVPHLWAPPGEYNASVSYAPEYTYEDTGFGEPPAGQHWGTLVDPMRAEVTFSFGTNFCVEPVVEIELTDGQ